MDYRAGRFRVGWNGSGRALACGVRLAALTAIALSTANCGSAQKVSSRGRGGVDAKYGVAASPRVIPEGQPIPKGGGRQMVGKPYTVAGRTYVPSENKNYAREGLASWYGEAFHGRLTANGEIFDRESIAAAHATMPLPSYARVTNVSNNRSMIVRVNDRGPYHENRIIDVSEAAANALGFHRAGTARVRVDYIGRASVNGSDDSKLLATLRDDGRPAGLNGAEPPVMLADAGESGRAAPAPASPSPKRAAPAGPIVLASASPMPLRLPEAERPAREDEESNREREEVVRASSALPRLAREAEPPIQTRPAALSRPPASPVRLVGAAQREASAPIRVAGAGPTHLPMRLSDAPGQRSLPSQGHASVLRSAPLPPGRPLNLATKATGADQIEAARTSRGRKPPPSETADLAGQRR